MTHPGDFTDTTVEQDLATASDLPWEQPVREVSLSARADTVSDMATVWQTYLTGMTTIAERLRDLWKHELSETWSGPAADACHSKWVDITGYFFAFVRNYGAAGDTSSGAGVPALLRDTATAIHDAIGGIPIPVFGHSNAGAPVLPNAHGASNNGTGWGDELYADYQAGPGSYADYAFRDRALAARHHTSGAAQYNNIPGGSRLRSPIGGEYDTGDVYDQVTANYNARADQAAYDDQIRAWYASNQRLAYSAYNSLLNTYAKHQTSVPSQMPQKIGSATATTTPPRWTDPTGADPTGTGTEFAGAGAGAASALPGAAHPDAALPASGNASLPGTTPGDSSGLSGVGTSAPVDTSSPSLGSAVGSDLGAGSGFGGDGGAGAIPGVGFYPPSGTSPGRGAEVVPDGLGRVVSGPAAGTEGAASMRNPAGSSGMGMMGPGYGGAAGQEHDESRTWLTEDQDIWGLTDKPDMAPPDGVI